MHEPVRFQGVHCTLTISRPSVRVVLITFVGREPGELGPAPFRELEKDFAVDGQIDVFVDARHGVSATLDVTGDWALFFRGHSHRLNSVNVLTASMLLQMAVASVRTFAGLEDRMRLFTDEAAFEAALAGSSRARSA